MLTQNNAQSMNTIVETFVIEETSELIYDNEKLEKWNGLVNEMGLSGQTSIVQKDKSPIPFLHMKQSIVNVFTCLCPKKVNIEQYNISPIPLEILELAVLAKRENYFDEVQIWYDDVEPDPACVGLVHKTWYAQNDEGNLKGSFTTKAEAQMKMESEGWLKRKPYPTEPTFYLLGKWADVKRSLDELKEIAIKRFTENKINELNAEIVKAQRGLIDVQTVAFDHFNNGKQIPYSF